MQSIVERSPGASTRDVAREAQLSDSGADYHLRRLEKRGLLTSRPSGRTRRWYASAARYCPVLQLAIPALRRPETLAVVRALDETPTTAVDLEARAGVPLGAVRWSTAVLHHAFLLDRTAGGRVVLREGARTCLERAAAGARCAEWGRCAVSQAWAQERGEGPTSSP